MSDDDVMSVSLSSGCISVGASGLIGFTTTDGVNRKPTYVELLHARDNWRQLWLGVKNAGARQDAINIRSVLDAEIARVRLNMIDEALDRIDQTLQVHGQVKHPVQYAELEAVLAREAKRQEEVLTLKDQLRKTYESEQKAIRRYGGLRKAIQHAAKESESEQVREFCKEFLRKNSLRS